MLRLVFMGSDPIALPLLDWLAGEGRMHGEVVCVFTQPDRPVGRGQKVQPNAIKLWAQAHGLPVEQPEKLTALELARLQACRADLALVMAYGHILRDEFIAAPRLGTVNLHASLLPKYRGASPIQTAIASGERHTGVSFMRIVRALDAGPVADTEAVAIEPHDTALDLEAKLAHACVPLLARTLPALAAGTLTFVEQEHTQASFCRRLEKADGALDFTAPAAVLAARINGLMPWPACSFVIGDQPIKAGLAGVVPEPVCNIIRYKGLALPGAVLGADGAGLLVATGKGTLRLQKMQRPGGRMLAADEFLRGFPLAAGALLQSQPMPVLVAPQPFPFRRH